MAVSNAYERERDMQKRNAMNLRVWREKLSSRRGSSFLTVDAFRDLRNHDQLRQWRTMQFEVRQTGRSKRVRREPVNLAKWEMRRLLNGRKRIACAAS